MVKRGDKKQRRPVSPAKQKLRARRALSQNFLIDTSVAARIAAALPLGSGDTVFEIGAGKGFLTEYLVETGARVWAVEKDRRMVGMLRKKFGRNDRVRIIHADVLSLPSDAMPPEGAWALGNLPYGIGHAILEWMMTLRPRWRGGVVMLQREVVRRLLADPGDPDRSAASLWFQARASGELLFTVPPAAFHPPPRVTSAVMRLVFDPTTPGIETLPGFELIVKHAFTHRRKVLENNLLSIPGLTQAARDRLRDSCADLLRLRAQELTAADFGRLVECLNGPA